MIGTVSYISNSAGMASIQTFRQLTVWQESHKLVLIIYKGTERYPKHELFGITSQTRRAAHSVPTNIVEGFRRKNIIDSLKFYNIADGSLEELKYHLLLASDLQFISDIEYASMHEQCETVGKLLTRWIQSQRHYLP